MKVLVTAGSFESADGELLAIDLHTQKVQTWGMWSPPEHLRVPGKGFAGGCIDRAEDKLYVAAHAAVVRWDLARAEVEGILHQPDFNDLHDVACVGNELLVVNTGSDAVERFTREGVFLGRWSFLPSWVQGRRMQGLDPASPESLCQVGWEGEGPIWADLDLADGYHSTPEVRGALPFHKTKSPDMVHPNHVVDVDGRLLVTCLYDGSFRDLGSMQPVFSVDGFPHDGVVVDEQFWFTTINGQVWRADLGEPGARCELVAELEPQGRVGWCRGLLVTKELIVVGLSEVKAHRLPKHRWSDAEPEASVTGVVVLDRSSGKELSFIDLSSETHRKIYSLLEYA